MTLYENPAYRYTIAYPTGWAVGGPDPAHVVFTGLGGSTITVEYVLDNTLADVTAFKAWKMQAFQATVSNFNTQAEAKDNATGSWKVTATYSQGTTAKKAFIFLTYPKPRGFFVVLSAATSDFDALQTQFNQAIASWQVPAIVK